MLILKALVCFFLHSVEGSDDILMSLFNEINTNLHNPLVKQQAFFYWRMLTKDQGIAQKVIFSLPDSQKPREREEDQNVVESKYLGTFINQLWLQKQTICPFLTQSMYQKQ